MSAALKKHPEDRFWSKVLLDDDEKCWEWKGCRSGAGYGYFLPDEKAPRKRVLAHRAAYASHYGELDASQIVRRRCRTRLCVNPSHLFLDTPGAKDRAGLMALTIERESPTFWDKVDKRGELECWEWRGLREPLGYGRVGNWRAYRLAWVLTNGEIPSGLQVCHRCDNPPCCNPGHLFLGTFRDNMRDRVEKGRTRGPRGNRCVHSKLSVGQVREVRTLIANGMNNLAISKIYNVNNTSIRQIRLGLSWAWLP